MLMGVDHELVIDLGPVELGMVNGIVGILRVMVVGLIGLMYRSVSVDRHHRHHQQGSYYWE